MKPNDERIKDEQWQYDIPPALSRRKIDKYKYLTSKEISALD